MSAPVASCGNTVVAFSRPEVNEPVRALLQPAELYVPLLGFTPLPSTGITRRPRYCGPVRHPRWPGLSLAGVRLGVTCPPRLGFPVLRRISVCRHAIATTPVGSLVRVASRGLPPNPPATAAFPVFAAGRL